MLTWLILESIQLFRREIKGNADRLLGLWLNRFNG
ncbi:Uncharacterised protein [Mycobacteroides abscessus]|nr:Uncharacterised protein [Mycobacteroides abscessus]